jgi:CBS domain-containing protein
MRRLKVRDIMVPLSGYTTLQEDATLEDAVTTLKRVKHRYEEMRDGHRAILIVDENGRVVGKVSQLDLILGLEEGYRKIGDLKGVAHSGYNPKFIKSIIERNRLWEEPLAEICRKRRNIKVKDVMYTPTEGEYVRANESLDVAIHQLGMGRHQSLLVTEDDRIVGILRLTDIFDVVHEAVQECDMKAAA